MLPPWNSSLTAPFIHLLFPCHLLTRVPRGENTTGPREAKEESSLARHGFQGHVGGRPGDAVQGTPAQPWETVVDDTASWSPLRSRTPASPAWLTNTCPRTHKQLLAIQKESGNNLCCDCNAPSPQWASPKFGIFICLSCAGVHRGLGVHISFVRSISMDAFKQTEIERMRLGGNNNWKRFFDEHEDTQMRGLTWDDATIAERYNGGVGEEWKERLSAKVEGREYVPGERKTTPAPASASAAKGGGVGSRSSTPLSGTAGASRSQSPGGGAGGKAKVDARYFESLGAANAARPEDLPPSEGGKYAGFGNTPIPKKEEGLPKLEDLQKDPLAALTKGFGWFSSTVTKTATTVNKDFIQPTTKQVRQRILTSHGET